MDDILFMNSTLVLLFTQNPAHNNWPFSSTNKERSDGLLLCTILTDRYVTVTNSVSHHFCKSSVILKVLQSNIIITKNTIIEFWFLKNFICLFWNNMHWEHLRHVVGKMCLYYIKNKHKTQLLQRWGNINFKKNHTLSQSYVTATLKLPNFSQVIKNFGLVKKDDWLKIYRKTVFWIKNSKIII